MLWSCRKQSYSGSLDLSNNPIDETQDINEPEPEGKSLLSREAKLEQLIDGLEAKFATLPENDPLRISILTILPESFTLREITEKFNVTFRIAEKARNLRHEFVF